jgi:hypothetical protein
MNKLSKHFLLTVWLFATVLVLQSCTEQAVQFEKQKVQFTLTPASVSGETISTITLPENALAMISVASSNGTSVGPSNFSTKDR